MTSTTPFSQEILQDYVDCPRRYQLRHVLTQPWPALLPPSPGEAELHRQRGADFHRLLHQRYAGIAPDELTAAIENDPILRRWWETYLQFPPADLPCAVVRPEVVVSAPVCGHRVLARFDLLAVEPGARAVVVDWKTSLKRPSRSFLAQRLQTRVYRYLLAAAVLPMVGPVSCALEQAEMVYWFCEFGGATERFPYSPEQFSADHAYLTSLISEIAGRQEAVWPLTPHEERCRHCNYRSLCERRAGPAFEGADEEDEIGEPEIGVDLEQIAEVLF